MKGNISFEFLFISYYICFFLQSSTRKSSRSLKGINRKYEDPPQLPTGKKNEKKKDPAKEAQQLMKKSLQSEQLQLLQKSKHMRLQVR